MLHPLFRPQVVTNAPTAGLGPVDSRVVSYLVPVLAAVVGLLAGLVVTARLSGRPLRSAWRPRRERPRDVVIPVTSAVLCLLLALRFGPVPVLPAYVYLAVVCVPLAAIDIEEHRLPDRLTLPSYPIALALLAVPMLAMASGRRHFVMAVLGMVGLWLVYLVLHLVNPRGLGWGDVKLAGVLGAYLGWLGLNAWLEGAFLGVLLGGVYALVLVVLRRATAKSAIALGPFMIAGALLAVLVSRYLVIY